MTTTKILEIDLSKLQPNKYNPRKTMDRRGLASLEKSLERDGQLQTILVRPIDKSNYEVVAGMRRYLSLKNLGEKKVVCTVQEMDDQTAMQKAFKENVEREPLSPIDEAMWFFEMLGLKEEQLFVSDPGAGGGGRPVDNQSSTPLPSRKNAELKALAATLDGSVTDGLIENRLPLLALPESMQRDVAREDGIPVKKAEVLARLRLIGNKDEAQKQMSALWKQASQVDVDTLNNRVNSILDSYRKKSEDVLKELGELERTITKRKEKIMTEVKEANEWTDTKSKTGLFQSMPKLVADNLLKVAKPKNAAIGYFEYEYLDGLANAITRDDTLSEKESKVAVKLANLQTGQNHIEEDECVYCGTHVEVKQLEKRIGSFENEREAIQKDIKTKDQLRGKTEQMKRSIGTSIREYEDVATKYQASIKTLITSKKITKEQGDKKVKEFLL